GPSRAAAPPSGRRPARAAGSACRCRATCHSRAYRSRMVSKGLSSLNRASDSGCDLRALLQVLVRRAVVAVGQRRALARLALARRGPAARHSAVEGTCLDLLLDEGAGGADHLVHGPGHLCLGRDGEVPPDVLEERAI